MQFSVYSMTDFAMARSMAINSTLSQHKSIHLQTCRSPGGLSAIRLIILWFSSCYWHYRFQIMYGSKLW